MKIFIHIGWHKTGTTSIQNFLLENRDQLAIAKKIYYPEEGLLTCAHHNLAWTILNKKNSPWGSVPAVEGGAENYIIQAVDKARITGCDTLIFSSEEFCKYGLHEIELLYGMVSRHVDAVKIIAYIRRQDLITESSYNMEVKWWGVRCTTPFGDYAKTKEGYPDYYKMLNSWVGVFGLDSVIVRQFDRASIQGGDVRVDFCEQIGISSEGLNVSAESSNDSLGPEALEFVKIINNLNISKEVHEMICENLLDYGRRHRVASCVLFEPEMRVGFMRLYDESNNNLFELLGYELTSLKLNRDQLPNSNVKALSLDRFLEIMKISGMQPT